MYRNSVVDAQGRDVTPLPLCPAGPGDVMTKTEVLSLDEIFSSMGSDHTRPTSFVTDLLTSSLLLESASVSSLSSKDSWMKETNNSLALQDKNLNPSVLYKVPVKRDCVDEDVTEEMLDEVAEVVLTESDTISLLDIPPIHLSEGAEDLEAVRERNIHYAKLCNNKIDNDKYLDQWMQMSSGMQKVKQTQKNKNIVVVEAATNWDRYDFFCEQNKTPEAHEPDIQDLTVSTRKGRDKRWRRISEGTGSTISSILEIEDCEENLNTQPDPENLLVSELFRNSLLVMERSIVTNIFQTKLAAYRHLPLLEDPDRTVKPGFEEQIEEEEESLLTPKMERLWVFVCDLTKGYNPTSMAWSKNNSDILAVGYGDCESRNPTPGLICCWSLKNSTWPERVYSCHSVVTCLDFSANNPGQLAVGMDDGSVSIYDVQPENKRVFVTSNRDCSRKHLHAVMQVTWTKQQLKLLGDEREEVLVSVSTDGRISKWFSDRGGLNCIDLMKLKKMKPGEKKKMTNIDLVPMTGGLCFDFHPTDFGNYLVGTSVGLIYEGSLSDNEQFLDIYKHHFGPVNHIEWSPFSPDVFLSCSSDWTMQLWKRGVSAPVMSFKSVKSEVYSAQWSSNCPALFAVLYKQWVEVWDLTSNIMFPSISHQAAPGVHLTSLLFAKDSDSILVGDSEGQVTVYKLTNLRVGQTKEVESLDDIIQSVSSYK